MGIANLFIEPTFDIAITETTRLHGKQDAFQIGRQRSPIPNHLIQSIQNLFLHAKRWREGDCFQFEVNCSDKRLAFRKSPFSGQSRRRLYKEIGIWKEDTAVSKPEHSEATQKRIHHE